MSEKHQECSECGKPLAHRVHSPAHGTHAYREPGASPQATEMQTRILDAAYAQQKRMEVASPQATRPLCKHGVEGCALCTAVNYSYDAAQPAAGTTAREQALQDLHATCDELVAAEIVSKGTTPQAERLARPLTQAEYEVEYAKLLKKYNEIMPMPRAVAPAQTRLTAEQFWPEWIKGKGKHLATKSLSEINCEFAEAYHRYAKEKERDNGAS